MSLLPQLLKRRERIRELLRAERIASQDALRRRLRELGIRAEQATLSRDLHALGVFKGPDGYVLPGEATVAASTRGELVQLARQFLAAADHTGPLAVLRTGPGRAQPLALALDGARIGGVLGTIAGDDTIFVATADPSTCVRLCELLASIARGLEPSEREFDLVAPPPARKGERR